MGDAMTHKELDKLLDGALTALNVEQDFPCSNQKPDAKNDGKPTSCLARDHGFDKDDRPVFWFGSDCVVARKLLCPTCLAYWHVAVARNIMLDDGRWHSNADDLADVQAARDANAAKAPGAP